MLRTGFDGSEILAIGEERKHYLRPNNGNLQLAEIRRRYLAARPALPWPTKPEALLFDC